MRRDPAAQRSYVDLRPPGAPAVVFPPRPPRAGLVDLIDGLAWPILTTAASLLPRRFNRLVRPFDDETAEADPIG